MTDLVEAIQNLDMKPKFDDTFECGNTILEFPLETSLVYMKYKKILVVSPRDMTTVIKTHRVSPKDIWIAAKTITLDSHPPLKNIVRAESPVGGWRVKMVRENYCKVWFYSEVDFKIALFLQKSVGPKSGHSANALREYILKNGIENLLKPKE
jgi:hypothetical protein